MILYICSVDTGEEIDSALKNLLSFGHKTNTQRTVHRKKSEKYIAEITIKLGELKEREVRGGFVMGKTSKIGLKG